MEGDYPLHYSGDVDAFATRTAEAVSSFLADPRAPVVEGTPDFFEAVAAQWRSGTSIGAILSSRSAFTDNDGESMTSQQVYDQLGKDGINQHRLNFAAVRDRKTYDAIKADIEAEERDRKTLESLGLGTSLLSGFAAALGDPINYIPMGSVAKAKGLVDAAKRGAIAGAGSTAASSAVVQGFSQTKTAGETVADIGAGTAFGALMGFGIHAVVGRRASQKIESRLDAVTTAEPAELAKTLQKQVDESNPVKIDPELKARIEETLPFNWRRMSAEDLKSQVDQLSSEDRVNYEDLRSQYLIRSNSDTSQGTADASILSDEINDLLSRAAKGRSAGAGYLVPKDRIDALISTARARDGQMSTQDVTDFLGVDRTVGNAVREELRRQGVITSVPGLFSPKLQAAFDKLKEASAANGGDYSRKNALKLYPELTAQEAEGVYMRARTEGIVGPAKPQTGQPEPQPVQRSQPLLSGSSDVLKDDPPGLKEARERGYLQLVAMAKERGDGLLSKDQAKTKLRNLLPQKEFERAWSRLETEQFVESKNTRIERARAIGQEMGLDSPEFTPVDVRARLRFRRVEVSKEEAAEIFRKYHDMSDEALKEYQALTGPSGSRFLTPGEAIVLAKRSKGERNLTIKEARSRIESDAFVGYADEIEDRLRDLPEDQQAFLMVRPGRNLSSGAQNDSGLSATGVYTASDRADDRLFGFIPITGTQKALGKIPVIGPFLRSPRLELQEANTSVFREAIEKIEMSPLITRADQANQVVAQKNFQGVLREMTATVYQAQQAAEDLFNKHKANYRSQDDFGRRVFDAVLSDGRSDDPVVAQAAQGYRKYFDDIQQRAIAEGFWDKEKQVLAAETYGPYVHLTENIRNDSANFIAAHRQWFQDEFMSQWRQAADAKKLWEAQNATNIAESLRTSQEKIAKVKEDYGNRNQGKIFDVGKKLRAERDKGISNLRDDADQKLTELSARRTDEDLTPAQNATETTKIREGLKRDIEDVKDTYKKRIDDEFRKLEQERQDKIAEAEAQHADFVNKLEEKRPLWDRTLLRKYGEDREIALGRALDDADKAANAYYDGATQNKVVSGINLPDHNLANAFKARKSGFWQTEAAKNGWIETNIFKLAPEYHRNMGTDIALGTVFKRVDAEGNLVPDPLLADVRRRGIAEYKTAIDNLRGSPEDEAKLVAERNRMVNNLDILVDLVRGSVDPNQLGANLKKTGQYLMMFNAWTKMGGTVASSLTDPVNIAIASGLSNSLKYGIVPAFKNLSAAMRKVPTEDLPDIYRINRIVGVVLEHQTNSRMAALADISNPVAQGKADAWMQRINKAFWDYSGITYWTTLWKNVVATTTHARLIMAANEGWDAQSAGTKAWLTNLKLTPKDLEGIRNAHAGQSEKFSAGVPYAALDEWQDQKLANIFANALDHETRVQVITPSAGDKLALQATPVGSLIWQFRTWGVSYTSRGVARQSALANIEGTNGKLALFAGIVGLTMTGTLIDGVKAALGDATIVGGSKDGKDNPFSKYIERWEKTPGEAMYNALDRSGTFWLFTEPSNMAQKIGLPSIQGAMSLLARDEPSKRAGSSRFGNRGVTESVLGPSFGMIEDVGRFAKSAKYVAGHYAGVPGYDTGELSREDFNRARRLLPFQNLPAIQQIMNSGHRELGTIFDWPEPR